MSLHLRAILTKQHDDMPLEIEGSPFLRLHKAISLVLCPELKHAQLALEEKLEKRASNKKTQYAHGLKVSK